MYKQLKLTILIFIVFTTNTFCQNDDSTRYIRGFEFNAGIYLNFIDFRNNDPIPFEKLWLKNGQKVLKSDFFSLIEKSSKLRSPIFTYQYNTDSIVQFELLEIWGYSNGRNIYINSIERGVFRDKPTASDDLEWERDSDFVRIGILGSLSHFTDVDQGVPPLYISDVDQYVLKIKTGEVLKFNKENLELVFEHDNHILESFQKDSFKKKKEKLKAVLVSYLKEYNMKYPLYFPK